MEVSDCKRRDVGPQNFDGSVRVEEAGPTVSCIGFDSNCHWLYCEVLAG